MSSKWAVLLVALFACASLCVAAGAGATREQDQEILRSKARNIMGLYGKPNWKEIITQYFTEDTVFEIPPSRRYKGLSGWQEFMRDLNLADSTSIKINTPINISGTAAAFTKEYLGKFNTRCVIKADQVVQILQFDEAREKIVKWTEFFHDETVFENQRACHHDEL